jgi:hypothetical protein
VYIEKLLQPPLNYSVTAICVLAFTANNLNETNFLPGHPVFDKICKTPFRVAILPYCLVTDKEDMRKRENRRVKDIFKKKRHINLLNQSNVRQESRQNVKLIMF